MACAGLMAWMVLLQIVSTLLQRPAGEQGQMVIQWAAEKWAAAASCGKVSDCPEWESLQEWCRAKSH